MTAPEQNTGWLEHLETVLDSIDARLGHLEKRLDLAGIPALADGIPDEDIPRYLALYTADPRACHMDPIGVLHARLAAFCGTADQGASK